MACLCPISIPDKVALSYGIKGASIVVPCGHCAGCARDRRNDWFVRLWSTYKTCVSEGKPVWFVTITIDPALWPDYNVNNPDIGHMITPFVRSWNERFRYLNGGEMPLRFICSEFGSNGREYVDHNGVKRVSTGALHFHGFLFGRFDIKRVCAGLAQTHGHMDVDAIRGPECIRYAVKYCTKDYSINDPLLRSRVFCSPGIGDSKYYFGKGIPTPFVLINGFHYRTPRYFLDKQWLLYYGKANYYDALGRSRLVIDNFHRRLEDYRNTLERLTSINFADPVLRRRVFAQFKNEAQQPASIDKVLSLLDSGLTGPSHPLISYYRKRINSLDFVESITGDTSFVENQFCGDFNNSQFNQQFNTYYHEGNQTFVPLSLDFET